ncbi:MAG TPA: ATP-binding protein [Acidimicrobiales bacterium]|nr:ATP-binding protein [Acidimicrobiales bacterium]
MAEEIAAADLWDLYGQDESGELEFKQALPKVARIQEPVVAFANNRGGTIVVGVTEGRPRRLLGVPPGQAFEERVQELARATHPPVALSLEWLQVDGAWLAAIHVAPTATGYVQTSDGRVIVRAGPTNRTLIGPELTRFTQERSGEPAEDQAVAGVAISDLATDRLRRFLAERLDRRRVDVPAAVRDLGMVTAEGDVRLATLLVFGREPQRDNRRFGIVVSRYEGASKGRPVLRDRNELGGPLPDLVEAADRAVYEEMRRDAVVRGLVREEVPEFPPVAIREALVNAVGHRDYGQRGASVEVRLFDDAVEIESPGTLAGYVTVDNLRDAQYSRNVRIMDYLQRLRLAEEAGTGIDKMISEMEDALLDPPDFEERSGSFLVRFKGGTVFTAEDRLWVGRFKNLALPADAKVAMVQARRQGSVSNEELREARRLDRERSRSVLQDLVARSLMAAIGRGRGTRYVLTEAAAELSAGDAASVSERLRTIVACAERNGSVANRDVRGLMGVNDAEARGMLETAVSRGLLIAVGERRGRRYLPRRT